MKPVISPRTRRSATVLKNASTAPAATCTRIGAGGQNERSGQRRASQMTSGVKAAHTHHWTRLLPTKLQSSSASRIRSPDFF